MENNPEVLMKPVNAQEMKDEQTEAVTGGADFGFWCPEDNDDSPKWRNRCRSCNYIWISKWVVDYKCPECGSTEIIH